MANPEHLAILKKGVLAWNEWRREHPEIRPDIREADLREAKLSGALLISADFSRADLSRAFLFGTDLSYATFSHADLSGANLCGAILDDAKLNNVNLCDAELSEATLRRANLSFAILNSANISDAVLTSARLRDAKLRDANLRDANLSGVGFIYADLNGADLIHADFTSAILFGTNFNSAKLEETVFTEAHCSNTVFSNIDLSTVIGLDTVRHSGPSRISIDTLYRSSSNIPEVFLRGCGIPESFITFARSLVNCAIDFYSCFISYSSKNQDFTERLYADLQSRGVRCWFAPEDLKIGDRFQEQIEESIKAYDKLLLILSKDSISSRWVEREVNAAFEHENKQNRIMLFPIRLDNSVMDCNQAWAADIRRTRHIGDFTRWKEHNSYHQAFNRLLHDLKAEEAKQD